MASQESPRKPEHTKNNFLASSRIVITLSRHFSGTPRGHEEPEHTKHHFRGGAVARRSDEHQRRSMPDQSPSTPNIIFGEGAAARPTAIDIDQQKDWNARQPKSWDGQAPRGSKSPDPLNQNNLRLNQNSLRFGVYKEKAWKQLRGCLGVALWGLARSLGKPWGRPGRPWRTAGRATGGAGGDVEGSPARAPKLPGQERPIRGRAEAEKAAQHGHARGESPKPPIEIILLIQNC